MNYEIRLEEFSGPMDLLLHFVKSSKLDIMDIKIEVIIEQYLDYIHQLESMNLNVASEYLVMASELLEIKSRMLLPREKLESDEEEEDPKEALVRRLIEYDQYKKMTENFKELELIRSEIYTKTPENLKEFVDVDTKIVVDVTLDDLMDAFSKFLERQKDLAPLSTKVTKKEMSVDERRRFIRTILKDKKRIEFTELFDVFTKEYVVVTFLAVLEMAKVGEISIHQDSIFDKIICEVV